MKYLGLFLKKIEISAKQGLKKLPLMATWDVDSTDVLMDLEIQ